MKNIVLNSRKRNAILFWTSQSDRQVDPILTDNTDYAVVPLHYEKIDPNNPYDYDVLIILVMNRNGEPESRHVVDVEPWYDTYNTDEEVSTKSDKEMFKDYIDEGLQMLRNKEIKHKKEMVSYLTLNKDVSNNQAELLTDEIFRLHDPETETEKGQQTLS